MSPGTVAAMEGLTPFPSSSLQPDAGVETRFTDLCKRLDLDESLTIQGMTLFKKIRPIRSVNILSIGSGSLEEVERIWFVFVLYCMTRLGKWNQEDGGRIKLFQILREAKLNAVDFFKEMPQISLKAGHMPSGQYSSDWERRLEMAELRASVVQLNHLGRSDVVKALKVDEACTFLKCTFGGVWNGGGGDGQKNLFVASFFFDRVAEAGFVDSNSPVAKVRPSNFEEAAKRACKLNMEEAKATFLHVSNDNLPYLCMDLVYQYTLLVDGFAQEPWQEITLVKRVEYGDAFVEAAWPLGSAIEVASSG